MRIIVVDDREEEQYLAETLLKGSGYEVDKATNGAEALEKLCADGFDMIISDILMPVMDGYQLCRECKEDKKLRNIPFVFYTATYKDERDEELASKVGADRFIRKPIDPGEFINIIQGVIRDMEEGKAVPNKQVVEAKEEVLKLYNERLVKKLEEKRLGLEAEIIERQRAEEQTKQLQEYLQLQIDRMPIGLIVWDTEFRMQSWNPAAEKIFGFTAEEVLGKDPYDLIVPKEVQPQVGDIWRRLLEGDMTAYSINENITKDGRTIICDWSNTPLKAADGTVASVLSMVQDITGRKEAEKKAREVETLKEVDRLRSRLLANVSHELRTPLTSIKGFATTLLRSDVKWSEEDQRDFLQSIDHETERLIRLVSDLLDMSRIEAGGLKLDKYNYQIAEILDSASSRLATFAQHHQLEVIVPSELPSVFVDQMRIGQVLTNLVENAAKYSVEGTPITIEAQLAGDNINISVTDRGQGIPAELLDKVFDRFYQAESIVSGRKSGTGLGLSICKGIIEYHGGRIWVESKLGEGSKFSFSLPVGKGEEETA